MLTSHYSTIIRTCCTFKLRTNKPPQKTVENDHIYPLKSTKLIPFRERIGGDCLPTWSILETLFGSQVAER